MRTPSGSDDVEEAAPDPARRRRILVVLALLVVLGLLYLARGALFPFIVSGVLAYLLYPVVRALESLMPWRERWLGASRIVPLWSYTCWRWPSSPGSWPSSFLRCSKKPLSS